MNVQEICADISKALAALSAPVTEQEEADGWSPESKAATHKYLLGLKTSLESGEELPPLGIARGLDHWGVTTGELLESVAAIANQAWDLAHHGAQL